MSLLVIFAPAAVISGIIELIAGRLARPKQYRPGMVEKWK